MYLREEGNLIRIAWAYFANILTRTGSYGCIQIWMGRGSFSSSPLVSIMFGYSALEVPVIQLVRSFVRSQVYVATVLIIAN